MKTELLDSIEGNNFKMMAFPPAGELLLTPETESLWSNEIRKNPELQKCAKERIDLLNSMSLIFDSLPNDMSIQEGLEKGVVNENEVVDLYNKISKMLENDLYFSRFILYMPFEILPNKEWNPVSEELNNSKNRFTDEYVKAWRSLLSHQDVRANFVDGDFTDSEINTKKIPRVVKAAHLVSKLIEKNLITFQEVVMIIKNNPDAEVARSMVEGLLIAEESGLFATFEENVLIKLKEEYITQNKQDEIEISESRQSWLDIEKDKLEIEKVSDDIVNDILSEKFLQEDLKNKYFLVEDVQDNLIGITALRKLIEKISKDNILDAKNIFSNFESELLRLWNSENSKIKDVLLGTWSHLKSIDIIDEQYLDSHEIKLPQLDGNIVERKDELKEDINNLRLCVDQMMQDKELSELLYPALTFYGSRVKGYGFSDSDYDVAIFVRPETSFDKRNIIREKLSLIFKEKKVNVKPVEFWLDENMSVRSFDFDNNYVADKTTVDPLFSGIMIGNNEIIKVFYENLLLQYLSMKNDRDSENERSNCLQDLERNNLQYRLMHRGYRHFFPEQGKVTKLSAIKHIDNKSAFWDSGYRKLASKIFVKKVFLPQLQK